MACQQGESQCLLSSSCLYKGVEKSPAIVTCLGKNFDSLLLFPLPDQPASRKQRRYGIGSGWVDS